MDTPKETVKVSVMQREFTIACPQSESAGLRDAAAYLDQQMRAISTNAQALGFGHCAIMAGLNICNELLSLRATSGNSEEVDARLANLNQKITAATTALKDSSADRPDSSSQDG